MFSDRTPPDLSPNRLTTVLRQLRREGRCILDLTLSNPTRAGLAYPLDLLAPLAHPRGLTYAPHAFGSDEAREAVAGDFARRGGRITRDQVVLTASTSEAYSLLFKTLCRPGDEVLVPHPSYPLFEHLTRLDAVAVVPYELEYHGSWTVSLSSVERALTDRTRAVLAVSPNNPTGSYLKDHEVAALERICASRGLGLIVDEVFADYGFGETEADAARAVAVVRALEQSTCLMFSLGGLSKSIGLPQVKLGWIGVGGPAALVAQALGRLEYVCDAYLSVSTPVQAAAAELLARGAPMRRAIHERVRANLRHLHASLAAAPSCRVLNAEGGWYAVLQVPSLSTEEDLVLDLLASDGLLVHPGFFFDFPRESFLIVSLLPPEAEFAEGVLTIVRYFNCRVGES